MNVAEFLFLVLSALAVFSALLCVSTDQLVHAALWLVITLGAVAGCYLLMTAEFVAWVQVLIYIGSVVVLLLFALMLTRAPTGPGAATNTGNRYLAAGVGLAADYNGTDDAVLCMFGDGASNQGTFGETMNLAALWKLPVVFMITNNQFGMGTSLERHSAVTDLLRKGEGFGVPGMRCDGMDVQDTYAVTCEALRIAREERRPVLVEALTYRFRGHSMADPEEYRTKDQVDEWRKRDPIAVFGSRLVEAGVMTAEERDALDAEMIVRVDASVAFADASPHPSPNELYDDIYVLGDQVRGWYSVDERTPTPHRGEDEHRMDSADLPRSAEHAGSGPVNEATPKPADDAQQGED